MGKVKALLVGVSDYSEIGLNSLPLCKNDLYEVRRALIKGLKVNPDDIFLYGETGMVRSKELDSNIKKLLSESTIEDTFIFYFSGHGNKNKLALSDSIIILNDLINYIEKTPVKNKIIILDSCHSGYFSMNGTPEMDLSKTIEDFAGHGYAVLASCGADQNSGFNDKRYISLYTSFLCDAFTNQFLIRKGKKSLEAINKAIFQSAELWNKNVEIADIQQPIFRSNIGGTIFFDVEKYKPYKIKQVYEETDDYIIYAVEPKHYSTVKRFLAKVILRYKSSIEQIADFVIEIKNKILYYEIHQNEMAETAFKGKAADIVWCNFAYDEDDIVNSNFVYRATWAEASENKSLWYKKTNNSVVAKGIHIVKNIDYEMIKEEFYSEIIDEKTFILQMKKLTAAFISIAEKYIKHYREYLNHTKSEEELIEIFAPLNEKISELFIEQGKLPMPPKELHDWTYANYDITGTIQNLSLYYNKKHMDIRNSENRKSLMDSTIKRYETDLETLKELDKL